MGWMEFLNGYNWIFGGQRFSFSSFYYAKVCVQVSLCGQIAIMTEL